MTLGVEIWVVGTSSQVRLEWESAKREGARRK